MVRDLLEAHANETPTTETVLRVLRAAAAVGLRWDHELGDEDAESVVAYLRDG